MEVGEKQLQCSEEKSRLTYLRLACQFQCDVTELCALCAIALRLFFSDTSTITRIRSYDTVEYVCFVSDCPCGLL